MKPPLENFGFWVKRLFFKYFWYGVKVVVYKIHNINGLILFRMDGCCWSTEIWLDCSLMITDSEEKDREDEIPGELTNDVTVPIVFCWYALFHENFYNYCQIICTHFLYVFFVYQARKSFHAFFSMTKYCGLCATYLSCVPLIKNETKPVLPYFCNQ